VLNVGQTTVVRDAWARGQELSVHGWIYDVADGLIRDLDVEASNSAALPLAAEAARGRLFARAPAPDGRR
jgi:carbonic anhydrase